LFVPLAKLGFPINNQLQIRCIIITRKQFARGYLKRGTLSVGRWFVCIYSYQIVQSEILPHFLIGREPDTLLLPPQGEFWRPIFSYSPVCPEYCSSKFATFQWGFAEKINFGPTQIGKITQFWFHICVNFSVNMKI